MWTYIGGRGGLEGVVVVPDVRSVMWCVTVIDRIVKIGLAYGYFSNI